MQIHFDRACLTLFSGRELMINGKLALAAPGIHFLVGGNGAGKTMLLNTLAKLLGEDESGPIDTIESDKLALTTTANLPLSVGRVRQDPRDNFISRCSSDEMILPMLHPNLSQSEIAERLDTVLARCDVVDEAILRRSIDHLSSGQQQLLGSCVALAPEPRILLFDEPFARLDPEAAERVSLLILSMFERSSLKTEPIVVIATHNTAYCSPHLRKAVTSVIRVDREESTIEVSQEDYRPDKFMYSFSQEILRPLRDAIGAPIVDGDEKGSALPKRRMRILPGSGEEMLRADRLELHVGERLVALLLNLRLTSGINIVEGPNASGKTMFGEFLGGFVPLNPLLWPKRRAQGRVELPGHSQSSLRSIRRRGMSVFLPAIPDLWLPERTVEDELQEFHRDGLDSFEAELLEKADLAGDRRISQLSFGQKRLLAVLGLPNKLEFVFLDEPFADLSIESANLVLELVQRRTGTGDWQSVILSLTQSPE